MAQAPVDLKLRAIGGERVARVFQRIQKSVRGVNRSLQRSETRFRRYRRVIDKSTGSITKFGKASMRVGRRMTTFMTAPIALAGGAALKTFADYEQGLIGVGKTTSLQGKSLQSFGEKIKEMAERMPLTQVELLKLAEAAGQMGVDGEQNILAFTETLAKLQTATDVVGDEGARSIARVLNLTNELDKSGKGVRRFGDTLTYLGNNLAATESEILAVATRIAGNASRFKLTSDEVLALAGTMRALGKNSELAGSVTGKVFNQIEQAVLSGGKPMGALRVLTGMTAKEIKKAFDDKPLDLFMKTLSGLQRVTQTDGNFVQVLGDIDLKGVRVNDILGTMVNKLGFVKEKMQEVKDGKAFGALDSEFNKFLESLGSQTKLALNTFKNLLIEVGEDFAPIALKVLDAFKEISNYLRKNDDIRNFLLVFTGFIATVGPALVGIGLAASAIAPIATLLAIGSFPILGGILALAIGVGYVAYNYEGLASDIKAVDKIMDEWNDTLWKSIRAMEKFLGLKGLITGNKGGFITPTLPPQGDVNGSEPFVGPPRIGSLTPKNPISSLVGSNPLSDLHKKATLDININQEGRVKAKVKENRGFNGVNINSGFQGSM